MITRPRDYLNEGEPSAVLVQGCIREFQTGLPRLNKLKGYYDGDRVEILHRRRGDNLPNNRLVHNYPKYITTLAAGYLSGNPVSYSSKDDIDKGLEAITDQYRRANTETIDSELATTASIFGRATELTYANENAEPRSASIDPRLAFVVYDDTVENKPMFGVHFFPNISEGGEKNGYRIVVYTDKNTTTYNTDSIDNLQAAIPSSTESHVFGAVPLTEYWNSDTEQGDFEGVITLIDAYNLLASDRINDKEQFVDAILVLTGARMDSDVDGRTPSQQIKEDRMVQLPDGASMDYITKTLSEADIKVLRDDINADIHKMSMVPDMSDDKFAGNVSGVAMRYKLFAFEQLTKMKERWFAEGLRCRLRLYANFLSVKGNPAVDVEDVQLTFTRSLPVNELEIAQMVSALQNIVPDEILLKQVPFVGDVEIAMKQLKAQRAESADRNARAFGLPDTDADGGEDDVGATK